MSLCSRFLFLYVCNASGLSIVTWYATKIGIQLFWSLVYSATSSIPIISRLALGTVPSSNWLKVTSVDAILGRSFTIGWTQSSWNWAIIGCKVASTFYLSPRESYWDCSSCSCSVTDRAFGICLLGVLLILACIPDQFPLLLVNFIKVCSVHSFLIEVLSASLFAMPFCGVLWYIFIVRKY